MQPKCTTCGGPYHPSSGHLWRPDVPVCGPCIRHFYGWLRGHAAQRRRGADFYAEAATSIRAPHTRSGVV